MFPPLVGDDGLRFLGGEVTQDNEMHMGFPVDGSKELPHPIHLVAGDRAVAAEKPIVSGRVDCQEGDSPGGFVEGDGRFGEEGAFQFPCEGARRPLGPAVAIVVAGDDVGLGAGCFKGRAEKFHRLSEFPRQGGRGKVPTKEIKVGGGFHRIEFFHEQMAHGSSEFFTPASNNEIPDAKKSFWMVNEWIEGNLPKVQIANMDDSGGVVCHLILYV